VNGAANGTPWNTNKAGPTQEGLSPPGGNAMSALTMQNPVFVTFMITAAIMILKIMGQGWMTVYRMLKIEGGFASPEDLQAGLINKNPSPEQLELNDYVDRSRRIHRNDLENIPAFLACGLLFVIAGPSVLLANILMYGFVAARLLHTLAYATKQSHEIRATLYTIGSLIVIIMAFYVLAAALS
jgi:glutathione S-transferase